jgi:endonuclease/exonuclease/phosphatase family metal-dependent hydrolase
MWKENGGIAVLWRKEVDVVVSGWSRMYIDVDMKEKNGRCWRFIGVYGESHSDQKECNWEMLRGLSTPNDGPWLCAGDFNEILHSQEKEGGRAHPQSYMDRFKANLEACDLQDLASMWAFFSWRNHSHQIEGYIRESDGQSLVAWHVPSSQGI